MTIDRNRQRNAVLDDAEPVSSNEILPSVDGVKRRSKRLQSKKRVIIIEDDENSVSNDDDDLICKRNKKEPDTKKRKKEAEQGLLNTLKLEDPYSDSENKISFDDLDDLVIQIIISYISSPRTLLNTSQCSKRISKLVTYEHVIRAAVLGGNKNASTSIENVVTSVDNNVIYVPTVQRLLRLANGRCCERGDQCLRYNRVTKQNPHVKVVGTYTGLMTCYLCDSIYFQSMKGDLSRWFPMEAKRSLFNNEVCAWEVPVDTMHEVSTGDIIGPMLTIPDISQIHYTHFIPIPIRGHSYNAAPDPATSSRSISLKALHSSKINADPNRSRRHELQHYLTEAMCDNEARRFGALEKHRELQREKYTKKIRNVQNIHNYLDQCIGNALWKSEALEVEWGNSDYSTQRTVAKYKSFLVDYKMQRFVSAPSCSSKKAIRQIASEICEVYDTLHHNDFFSFQFLRANNKWERALHSELNQKERNLMHGEYYFSRCSINYHAFSTLVLGINFRDALAHQICGSCRRSGGLLSTVFARVIHESDPTIHHAYFSHAEFCDLARSAYEYYRREGRSITETRRALTMEELIASFESANSMYETMKRNVITYLNLDLTRNFIRENLDHIRGMGGLNSRDIMSRAIIFCTSDMNELISGDFHTLLERHQRYFMLQNVASYQFLRGE